MDTEQLVISLIKTRREDDWWDFKREHHHDKAELVHDILCMANNRPRRDSYIIFGVADDDCSITGVENDSYRRNQQGITDILRNITFVGSTRPRIEMQTFTINNHEIDVLIIKDSLEVPYYLEKDYQDKDVKNKDGKNYGKIVRAYHVYTRVVDNNTPIDKQADLNDVEFLWRKRFGLLESPLDRIMMYLKNSNLWDCSSDNYNSEKLYYRFSPEFTIESIVDDSKDGYQYYLFNQTDIHPRWYDINLYYHQTMLASLEGLSLDGGRYFTPSPRTDGISLTKYHHWDISFKYFIKDSIEHIVNVFYYHPDGDDETIAHDKFMDCILLFETNDEKERFKNYVFYNWNNKEEYSSNIWMPYFEEIEGYNMDVIKEEYRNSQILQKMLVAFRKEACK